MRYDRIFRAEMKSKALNKGITFDEEIDSTEHRTDQNPPIYKVASYTPKASNMGLVTLTGT